MNTNTNTNTWVFSSAPTFLDAKAVACDLVTPFGVTLASCLWADGELDFDSDECGVTREGRELGLSLDDVDWPDEDAAIAAIWGTDAVADETIVYEANGGKR